MGSLFASLATSLFSHIVTKVLQNQNQQKPSQVHTPEVSIANNGVL